MDVKARVSSGDELLNEKFTIPSIITTPNPIDFNTFTKPGIYYLGSHSKIGGTDCNFVNCGPINNWGTLIVSGNTDTLFQLFFTDVSGEIYHRYSAYTGPDYTWKNWSKLIDKNSALDKAFPVGFLYVTTQAAIDKKIFPSFGTWEYSRISTILSGNAYMYEIWRTA